MFHEPRRCTDFSELDGLLGRQIHHDESVRARVLGILDGLFLAMGQDGVVVAYVGSAR